MTIVAVDDEKMALEILASAIREAAPEAELHCFRWSEDALAYAEKSHIDVAFLDVAMPGANGVQLAQHMALYQPKINIVFATGFGEYRDSAFDLHASGYLTTPLTAEALKRELDDLRHPVQQYVLRVQCQGRFEVFLPNGEPVHFSRSKSQELFAYLVYRRGAGCTVRELTAVLFEDTPYNERVCRYLQTISASLMTTLRRVGAESVIDKRYNHMAVDMYKLDCDWDSDWDTSKLARRRFMLQYDWAGPETIVPPVQEGP